MLPLIGRCARGRWVLWAGAWAAASLWLSAEAPTAVVAAQDEKTDVKAGVFSRAQASRGEEAYGAECASCHRDDLTGSDQAPALVGDGFLSTWDGRSVGDLVDRIQTTMPVGRPGTLSRATSLDIVAFLLDANGFRAGPSDLSDTAVLKHMRIVRR